MPPLPKDPSRRRRTNRTAGARVLHAVPKPKVPKLPHAPDGGWHKATSEWWAGIWSSPMSPEWDSSDIHGLYMLALLVNEFWTADTATKRKDLAGEIRLQSQRFGLSPIDRRRLQWEIERSDEAAAKNKTAAQKRPSKRKDPRSI